MYIVTDLVQKWILSKVSVHQLQREQQDGSKDVGFALCLLLRAEVLSSDSVMGRVPIREPSGINISVNPSKCHFKCSVSLRTWQRQLELRRFFTNHLLSLPLDHFYGFWKLFLAFKKLSMFSSAGMNSVCSCSIFALQKHSARSSLNKGRNSINYLVVGYLYTCSPYLSIKCL